MKQKIIVIVMLFALVGSIVGAYFLYDGLKGNVQGGQLVTPGSGSDQTTDKGTSDDDKTPSSDNTDTENSDAGSTESGSGDGEQTDNGHDHSGDNSGDSSSGHGDLIKAYDFTVYDANGNKVKLSDFFGKPIVLNFWASWCPPCQSEMPAFDEIYKEYKNDIHFLMVNLTSQDTVEDANSSISKGGYSFPIYYDKDASGAYAYGVSSIPVTYFIDKDGYLTAYGNFPFDKETLLKGINMIYKP